MDNYSLIKRLAMEREMEEDKVIELFSSVIQEFYQQKNDPRAELNLHFDPDQKKIFPYRVYKIVEEVNDPAKEISSQDEIIQKKKGKIQDGNLLVSIDLKELIDYQEFLKKIRSLLNQVQKEKWSKELLPYQGKIIEGEIREIHDDYCLVNLLGGKAVGYWKKSEWLPKEKLWKGRQLRFFLSEVKEDADYPLILARKNNFFLQKLFALEVPEIAEGRVVIRDVLRDPGILSKVAVESKENSSIDPVRACVGKNGLRINNIINSLNREKISLVYWSENTEQLIINILSPAKIISLIKKKDHWLVIVPQSEMSLILAHGGSVVKLISEYLKQKIHIKSLEEAQKENLAVVWNGNYDLEEYRK